MAVGTTAAGGDFCEKWLNVVGKYVWIGKIAKISKILLKNYILVGLGKSFSSSATLLKHEITRLSPKIAWVIIFLIEK